MYEIVIREHFTKAALVIEAKHFTQAALGARSFPGVMIITKVCATPTPQQRCECASDSGVVKMRTRTYFAALSSIHFLAFTNASIQGATSSVFRSPG